MPLRPVEDPDPLLAFSSEARAAAPSAPPLEPALQPIAAAEDRPSIQQPPESKSGLLARVERLEQALAESKRQIATLHAEKATLVRTLADNRAQGTLPRPPLVQLKAPARIASAIAGLAIGITLGIGGWMFYGNDDDVSLSASAAATANDIRGLAPNVAPAPSDRGLAPTTPLPSSNRGLAPNAASAAESFDRGRPPKAAPARGRAERGQPSSVAAAANVGAAKYVGTLTIDADPGGEVFVDRKRAGQTPLRLTNLRAGSHLIWIERDGYRRYTRVVQVPADRITRLSADLEPLAAR